MTGAASSGFGRAGRWLLATLLLAACAPLPGAQPAGGAGAPGLAPARAATPRAGQHGEQVGLATWYGARFAGRRTAGGSRFDPDALTAAHRTLRLHSRVRVTNLENGRSVVVRVVDRGPYRRGAVIDLSRAAARRLGFLEKGKTRVRLEVLPDGEG